MEEENKKIEFKAGKEITLGKLTFVVDKPIIEPKRLGKKADVSYDASLKQLAEMFEGLKGKEHHVTLTIPDKIEGASFKSKIKGRIEKLGLSDKMHVEVSTKRTTYTPTKGENKDKEVKGTVATEVRIHKGMKPTKEEKDKAEKKA